MSPRLSGALRSPRLTPLVTAVLPTGGASSLLPGAGGFRSPLGTARPLDLTVTTNVTDTLYPHNLVALGDRLPGPGLGPCGRALHWPVDLPRRRPVQDTFRRPVDVPQRRLRTPILRRRGALGARRRRVPHWPLKCRFAGTGTLNRNRPRAGRIARRGPVGTAGSRVGRTPLRLAFDCRCR